MELDTWRNGLKLSIENILRLRDDGLLLMEKGSYGHAYFSFYTAMEELWKAYFIVENFNNPEPKKLKKYLKNHAKK